MHGLQGVHGHAQLVQRGAHLIAQHLARQRVTLQQIEQAHQLHAHAVVDVAHQALALLQRGLVGVFLAQLGMPAEQFGFALAHALVQRDRQRAVLARHAGEAPHQQGAHQQREQRNRVGHERGGAGIGAAQAHHQPLEAGGTQMHRACGEDRQGARGALAPGGLRHGDPQGRGHPHQRRQHQGPEPWQSQHERCRAGQQIDAQQDAKPPRLQQLLAVDQHQEEVAHQHQVGQQRPGAHGTPPGPGQGRLFQHPVKDAQRAGGRAQAHDQVKALAL